MALPIRTVVANTAATMCMRFLAEIQPALKHLLFVPQKRARAGDIVVPKVDSLGDVREKIAATKATSRRAAENVGFKTHSLI